MTPAQFFSVLPSAVTLWDCWIRDDYICNWAKANEGTSQRKNLGRRFPPWQRTAAEWSHSSGLWFSRSPPTRLWTQLWNGCSGRILLPQMRICRHSNLCSIATTACPCKVARTLCFPRVITDVWCLPSPKINVLTYTEGNRTILYIAELYDALIQSDLQSVHLSEEKQYVIVGTVRMFIQPIAKHLQLLG